MKTFLLFFFALIASFAAAHDPELSGIRILHEADRTEVVVTAHGKALGASSKDAIDRAIRKRLKLSLDGVLFGPDRAIVVFDAVSDLATWRVTYPMPTRSAMVASRLFPESQASRTLITLSRAGRPDQDILLDATHPDFRPRTEATPGSTGSVAWQFIQQGIGHILSGADHVLFVVGLLLLGGGLKPLLKIVTAFTVAHSITLTLAATGIANPPSRIVEPLIALSIVAVAVENLRSKPNGRGADYRPWVAFGFGLVHGFGFAGALSELGLSGSHLATALLSFNVGVEFGQAIIVVLAAPIIAWFANRKPVAWRIAMLTGSCAIAVVGFGWFVMRALEG